MLLAVAVDADPFWAPAAAVVTTASVGAILTAGRAGLGWCSAVPLFYGLFLVIVPVVQEWLGVDIFSRNPATAPALWFATAGILSYSTAAYLGLRFAPRKATSWYAAAGPFALLNSWITVAVLFAIGLIANVYSFLFGYFGLVSAVSERGPLAGLMNTLTPLVDISMAVAAISYLSQRRRAWAFLLASTVLVSYAFALFSKSKGALLTPVVIVAAAYVSVRGKIPGRAAIAGLMLYVFFAFPFVTMWREVGTYQYASRTEQLREGVGLLLSGEWLEWDRLDYQAKETIGRGLLPVFTDIVAETGHTTPLERGSTYSLALAYFIPRFIWPGKPDMNIGNFVGHKYSVLQPDDDLTNVAPSFMGELFMNFGSLGLVLGMALLGVLGAVLDRSAGSHVGAWFRVWTLPLALFGQEGTVGHVLVPLGKAMGALTLILIVLWVMAGRARWEFGLKSRFATRR